MLKIILASTSPRRKMLLRQLGINFESIPADITENSKEFSDPGKYAMEMSREKALYVANKFRSRNSPHTYVLGADTTVCIDGKILGKPKNKDEAKSMLRLLQGRWHEVATGITLVRLSDMNTITEKEVTRVKVAPFSDSFIDRYVATGEPMDKAGSYGAQGFGALIVERLEGCYFNVIGLPLLRISRMLEREGYEPLGWLQSI
jgi:septum formation protein